MSAGGGGGGGGGGGANPGGRVRLLRSKSGELRGVPGKGLRFKTKRELSEISPHTLLSL